MKYKPGICRICKKTKNMQGLICPRCKQKRRKIRILVCNTCNREKEFWCKGKCRSCYTENNKIEKGKFVCSVCNAYAVRHAKTLCKQCYAREQYHVRRKNNSVKVVCSECGIYKSHWTNGSCYICYMKSHGAAVLSKSAELVNLSVNEYQRNKRNWKNGVKNRDRTCMICRSNKLLEVHHIFHFNKVPKLGFSVNNGILLCRKHHQECHWRKIILAVRV